MLRKRPGSAAGSACFPSVNTAAWSMPNPDFDRRCPSAIKTEIRSPGDCAQPSSTKARRMRCFGGEFYSDKADNTKTHRKGSASALLLLSLAGAVRQENGFRVFIADGHRRVKVGLGIDTLQCSLTESRRFSRRTRGRLRSIEAVRLIKCHVGSRTLLLSMQELGKPMATNAAAVAGVWIIVVRFDCILDGGRVGDRAKQHFVRIHKLCLGRHWGCR